MWVEHPLVWGEAVFFATNDHNEVTELSFVLALNEGVSSWDLVLSQLVESESWNGHEGSSGVESDHATACLASADVHVLPVDLDVIELHTEHVLELNIIPVDVSVELRLVEVPKRQVRFHVVFPLVFNGSQKEGEHIALQKLLVDHFVEYWGDSSFSEGWVSQSNNCLEVRPGKNSVLLLDITKLLILNMNLSTRFTSVARSQPNVISNKVSCKVSRSEEDLSLLWRVVSRRGGKVVVGSLLSLSVSEVNHRVEHPCVRGTRVEQTFNRLWWITNEHLRYVSVILQVILNNMSLHFFSWFINWAMGDIVNLVLRLGLSRGLDGV